MGVEEEYLLVDKETRGAGRRPAARAVRRVREEDPGLGQARTSKISD